MTTQEMVLQQKEVISKNIWISWVLLINYENVIYYFVQFAFWETSKASLDNWFLNISYLKQLLEF